MSLRLTEWRSPQDFRAHVGDFLGEHEAENNLLFGIVSGIADGRQKFSDDPPLLVSVEDESGIQLVAVRTPPLNVVLSTAMSDEAVAFLSRTLWDASLRLPGAVALSSEAEIFARTWSEVSGARTAVVQSQRIYRLERVTPPAQVSGRLRPCGKDDLALAGEWMHGFSRDVGAHQVPADAARFVGQSSAGLFFWIDDDRPVSMAGYSGPTPNGIRVGPVYTPPGLRGHGYASGCVAALSQRLLDEGRKFCFLYTDLANPTSNRIYQDIGYRPVCDSAMLKFEY